MKNYLQQLTYASVAWLVIFLANFGIELFQIVNETRITLMGLRIQNIDTDETLTNFFSLTPRFYMIYLLVISTWLIIYTISKKIVVK